MNGDRRVQIDRLLDMDGVRADVVHREQPAATQVMFEAEVPLLGVRVLEVVAAEVQLIDRQELIQVVALSGQNGDVARRQNRSRREA